MHQYAIAATQGHDVINAIRAAGGLREAGAGKKALVYGWSQGGGATIAAASSGEYIKQKGTAFDGIEMVGFVAMAPPDVRAGAPEEGEMMEAIAEKMLDGLAEPFAHDVFNFTHLAMSLWATQAAFSDNTNLNDLFSNEGVKVLDEVLANMCMHVAADTLHYTYGDEFGSLMKKDVSNAKAWINAILAGGVPNEKPVAPVIIYWGTKDTAVPQSWANSIESVCVAWARMSRVCN